MRYNRDDIVYDVQVTDIGYGDELVDHGILSYALLIRANNRRKVIDKFMPPLVNEVSIAGYFSSPFENRIMIVVAELSWFQNGHRGLRSIGSYLGAGFE